MIQPYPDGISSRRTSAMAGLALGLPIVSTSGHLTETIWAEHAAVVLTPIGDHGAHRVGGAPAAVRRPRKASSRRPRPEAVRSALRSRPHHRGASPCRRTTVRIAILTQTSRPFGGLATYLQLVIPALAEHGHDIGFWHEFGPPPTADPLALPPGCHSSSIEALGVENALRDLRAWQPDVLFAHGLSDPDLEARTLQIAPAVFVAHAYYGTCISGAKAFKFPTTKPCNRRFGWPCVANFYPRRCGGWSPITMARDFRRQSDRLALLSSYRAIVTLSTHMQQESERHGLHPTLIRGAIEAGPVSDVAPAPAGDREWRLLFVGRMDNLKGGIFLIDALPLAARELKRTLSLTFAGDGPARASWSARAAALDSRDSQLRVEFAGWLNREEVDRRMAAADLLVLPSVWPEPFGLVGLEAGHRRASGGGIRCRRNLRVAPPGGQRLPRTRRSANGAGARRSHRRMPSRSADTRQASRRRGKRGRRVRRRRAHSRASGTLRSAASRSYSLILAATYINREALIHFGTVAGTRLTVSLMKHAGTAVANWTAYERAPRFEPNEHRRLKAARNQRIHKMKTLRTAIIVALVSNCRLPVRSPTPRRGLRRPTGTVTTSGTAEFAAGVAVGADSRPVVVDTVCSTFGASGCQSRAVKCQQRHRRRGLDVCRYGERTRRHGRSGRRRDRR